jgi:hypothetical protein
LDDVVFRKECLRVFFVFAAVVVGGSDAASKAGDNFPRRFFALWPEIGEALCITPSRWLSFSGREAQGFVPEGVFHADPPRLSRVRRLAAASAGVYARLRQPPGYFPCLSVSVPQNGFSPLVSRPMTAPHASLPRFPLGSRSKPC